MSAAVMKHNLTGSRFFTSGLRVSNRSSSISFLWCPERFYVSKTAGWSPGAPDNTNSTETHVALTVTENGWSLDDVAPSEVINYLCEVTLKGQFCYLI